ncbi:MAG: tetratricopeptide repeat protein [Fimbriimonadaceae bacterium]
MKCLVGILMAVSASAGAQMCAPPEQAPIVSYPSGTIIHNVGTSDLTVTTKSEKCRQLVKQGFALLHCFWFNESVRSFRDATKEDPECAIAWCGLNAIETMPWNRQSAYKDEAEFAIKRAVQLSESASKVEQALIVSFRVRSLSDDDRKGAFRTAMEKVVAENPSEMEPRLLLAGVLTQLCMNDRSLESGEIQNELKSVYALIEPVLKRDPRNAAALHYHIHAMEGSRPELAIPSAKLLPEVASASAHMVHMAGHIYNTVGMWTEGDKVFKRSQEVGEAYAKELGKTPNEADWNYGHNNDYFSVNLMEQGRVKEAIKLQSFGGRKAEFAWRNSNWKELLEIVKENEKSKQSMFYRGLAFAYLGQLEDAKKALKVVLGEANTTPPPRTGKVSPWLRQEETRSFELEGLITFLSGEKDRGIQILRRAVESYDRIEYDEPSSYMRPPHESLVFALRSMNKPKDALKVLDAYAKVKKNSAWTYYLRGRCYEDLRDEKSALKWYREYQKIWTNPDPELEPVAHVEKFMRDMARKG